MSLINGIRVSIGLKSPKILNTFESHSDLRALVT